MMIKLESFFDEPIVIFRLAGNINHEELARTNAEAILLLHILGIFYAVLDTHELEVDWSTLEQIIFSDLTVLQNSLVRCVRIGDRIDSENNLPSFKDEDDALRYVREDLARRAHSR